MVDLNFSFFFFFFSHFFTHLHPLQPMTPVTVPQSHQLWSQFGPPVLKTHCSRRMRRPRQVSGSWSWHSFSLTPSPKHKATLASDVVTVDSQPNTWECHHIFKLKLRGNEILFKQHHWINWPLIVSNTKHVASENKSDSQVYVNLLKNLLATQPNLGKMKNINWFSHASFRYFSSMLL